MEHTCASCKRTTWIPTSAAWPEGCAYCGGTVWTTGLRFDASETFAPTLRMGSIDTISLANGLLRQPGSPSINPPNR